MSLARLLGPLVLLSLALVGAARADADLRALDDGQGGGAGYRFEPDRVEAQPGERLDVQNEGQEPHTVTHDAPREQRLFDLQNLQPGAMGSVRAPQAPGKYPFKCVYHPEMTGVLVVKADGPPTGTTPTEGTTPSSGTDFDPTVGVPPTNTGDEVPVPGLGVPALVALVGALSLVLRRRV